MTKQDDSIFRIEVYLQAICCEATRLKILAPERLLESKVARENLKNNLIYIQSKVEDTLRELNSIK